MDSSSLNTSLESERPQPLTQTLPTTHRMSHGLNDRLNTAYIDINEGDTSFLANQTRSIAACVGRTITPRQILIILRILKALTFAFLVFTLIADLMYIFFVEFFVSSEVSTKIGGTRDTIIRIYGLVLAAMALAIELDMANVVKLFPGFKGFIPRAFLLFFIAAVTNSHPLHESHNGRNRSSSNYSNVDDNYSYDAQVSQEIPDSTVVFQMVTSVVLYVYLPNPNTLMHFHGFTCHLRSDTFLLPCPHRAGCAITYLILGLLCFDRFKSKAFLSKQDLVAITTIPSSSGIQVSPLAQCGNQDQPQALTREPQANYELV